MHQCNYILKIKLNSRTSAGGGGGNKNTRYVCIDWIFNKYLKHLYNLYVLYYHPTPHSVNISGSTLN